MPREAIVHYHLHGESRPTYRIDAGGIAGKLDSPPHAITPVRVRDVRTGEVEVSFARDAVAFLPVPTAVADFEGEGWQSTYDRELIDLLRGELGAREVRVFDHTLRIDDPDATRQPARNVHTDYSPEGAHQRLVDLLGEAEAPEWSEGHYGFVNVWRPVGEPINSAPLGFVRPSTVVAEDWILVDLIYPDRMGHIMGLAANDDHEWLYQSRMAPGEVAVFNIYDNRGLPSVGHSALDLTEDASVHTVRRSIESRTLVRY